MMKSSTEDILKAMKKFKKTLNTKTKAKNFLIKCGILTKNGNLRKPYK